MSGGSDISLEDKRIINLSEESYFIGREDMVLVEGKATSFLLLLKGSPTQSL